MPLYIQPPRVKSDVLEKIGVFDGLPTWNGSPWPGGGSSSGGDMFKLIYDKNNDGVVDRATLADSVAWNSITGKPTVFTPDVHTHDELHKHDNKSILDKISILDDVLQYDGQPISIEMIDWNDVINKPSTFPVADHTHNTLDGMTTSIDELNYLHGVTSNVQAQINNLSSVSNYFGTADTYADISTVAPNPNNSDMIIVLRDELHDANTSVYMYNGTAWIYCGEFKTEIRDFNLFPVNLATEISGVLTEDHIDSTLVRTNELPATINQLDDTVKVKHEHLNKVVIDALTDSNGVLLYKELPIVSGPISWSNVDGKPESTIQQIDSAVSMAHASHTISDVTDLQSMLDLKANFDHTHAGLHEHGNKSTIDKFSEVDGKLQYNGSPISSGDIPTNLQISDITNLETTLANKANTTQLHEHDNKNVLDGFTLDTDILKFNGTPIIGGDGGGTVSWSGIVGRPSSTPNEIDSAISSISTVSTTLTSKADKSELHGHENKTILDKLTELDGNLQYNGLPISGGVGGVSTWDELSGKPTSTPEQIDASVAAKHTSHKISDVENLSTALALKANTDHTHNQLHSHSNLSLLETYTATNSQITDTVNKSHAHNNVSVLNNFSINESGELLYNGSGFAGDMTKAIYDTDDDGIVDTAKTISGLTATITELNHLTGVTSNIQEQLNALSQVAKYAGSVATKADLTTTYPTPVTGDMVIVLADETQGSVSTIYVYNGTSWIFTGEFKSELRDFTVKPIDLATEVTGLVAIDHLPSDVVKRSEFTKSIADVNSAVSLKHEHLNKALLDTYTASNIDIHNTISKAHDHTNISTLEKITANDQNEPRWDGNKWPSGDISYYFSNSELPTTGELNKLYVIYSDTTQNEISALYVWNGNSYTLIGGTSSISDATPTSMFLNQVTKLNVINGDNGSTISSTNPKTISLPIQPTDEFKLPKIEVLKYAPGETDITTTLFNFDNSDASDFEPSEYVVFDGKMKLKTQFEYIPVDDGYLGEGKVRSVTFDISQFKEITSMTM